MGEVVHTLEYDEATCVTAGELRAMGIAIPESTPDVAWVRRCDLRFTPGTSSLDSEGIFKMVFNVEIVGPFQWITLNLELKEPG